MTDTAYFSYMQSLGINSSNKNVKVEEWALWVEDKLAYGKRT